MKETIRWLTLTGRFEFTRAFLGIAFNFPYIPFVSLYVWMSNPAQLVRECVYVANVLGSIPGVCFYFSLDNLLQILCPRAKRVHHALANHHHWISSMLDQTFQIQECTVDLQGSSATRSYAWWACKNLGLIFPIHTPNLLYHSRPKYFSFFNSIFICFFILLF